MVPAASSSRPVVTALIALLLLLGFGAYFINLYVEKERQRDLLQWEARLGLVADTRADAIQSWVEQQYSSLRELAGNAALQLYVWQLSQQQGSTAANARPRQEEPPQRTYLRNLLRAAAVRYGFTEDRPRIPANLPQVQATGLVLLNAQLQPIVSTAGMPELSKAYIQAARQALEQGVSASSDLRLDNQERPVLAFAVPVKAVLGAGVSADKNTGVLLGIRNAEQDIFPLLLRGAMFAEESEAFLVKKEGDSVIYLSPTADGGAPLRRSLPLNRKNLASASAVADQGGFSVANNYEGREVLSVSRPIKQLPWRLVQQVNASQALRESNQRARFLLTTLSLLLLAIGGLTIAAWRHGSSVRAQQQARELEEQASQLQARTELLYAITDNIESHTLLLGADNKVLFVNEKVADVADADASELINSSLAAVIGSVAAGQLANDIDRVRSNREACRRVLDLEYDGRVDSYQIAILPIERVGEHATPVLLVLHDISELQESQTRQTRLMSSLLTTLVHLVDRHDPYSANHSSRTEEVCAALAQQLQLNAADRETLYLAATLGNLGKIMIPPEVLTKTEPLTEEERAQLQEHVPYGIELLMNLDFDGPVLATIAQKQETIDGGGYPQGLSGEQMSLTGKILSVANAFVALVSPRAYRDALPVREAVEQLMKNDADKYDRHVTAALLHITENVVDWSDWSDS